MTSKINFNNIYLQLGDIIKFNAPSNSNLHEKIFIIDFINNEKINLKKRRNKINVRI